MSTEPITQSSAYENGARFKGWPTADSGIEEETDWAYAWGTAYSDLVPERVDEVELFWAYSPEGGGSVQMASLLRLDDGTFATLCAWADYTGWGCQDGSEIKQFDTRDEALRFGLDEDERRHLGVTVK